MQGITEYDRNGVHILKIHYTADEDKRSPEWTAVNRAGMSQAMWDKEYEINFDVITGKAWFGEFRREFHVAREPLRADPGRPVLRGWDYGLTPATVFAQASAKGQLLILYELQSWDTGITAHGLVVQSESASLYAGFSFADYGDPAGNQRAQTDEKSCNDILREKYGINVLPGPVAEQARHEALRGYLTRLAPDGAPMLLIDPRCSWLIRALEGGYQHKEVAGKYLDVVADNEYTHIVDGLMYLAAMVGGSQNKKEWRSRVGAIL